MAFLMGADEVNKDVFGCSTQGWSNKLKEFADREDGIFHLET
jgi:hypothetical protein